MDGRLIYVCDSQPAAELEFRQLRYFVSVAEELHFGRAAARMFISQPALSQAIAGLERALDVKLFARTRQNVELTDAGAELLRHARGMLADREEAVAGVRRVDRGEAGLLRVGVALLAEHEVSPALAALAARCPGLILDRTAATSERLLAALRDHDLHAAVVHQLPVLATLDAVEWEVLRRVRLAALVSAASALARREQLRLSELSDQTFLVAPREVAPSAFEGLKAMCRAHGDFEANVVELSPTTVPPGPDWQRIADGGAIALMPEGTAQAAQRDGATVAVSIAPPPFSALAVAWRRRNASPVLRRFLAFMRAYRDEHGWAAEA